MRCACKRPGRRAGSPWAPEVYLIAERRDQKLGLVVPEQLTTGLIEIQSPADYPLCLPAGWEVAKVRNCPFVPYGPRVSYHVSREFSLIWCQRTEQGILPRRSAAAPLDRLRPMRPQDQEGCASQVWAEMEI